MLQSITEAVGNGGLIEVNVPPHISRSHITVYVDFVPTTAFEWLSDERIRVLVPQNKTVRVVRNSSPGERLTTFEDGTGLGAQTLNVDSLQAFYLAQEARDIAILQGSAVGTPAPGTESTTAGLLQLLTGQITVNQLVPSLAGTIGLVTDGVNTPGSVNARISAEQQARAAALAEERDARSAALQAEAQARQTAITTEAQARQEGDNALAQQVTTLTTAVSGATAAVQSESLARVNGDAALAQQINTVQAAVGEDLAEVREYAESVVANSQANANYTIKVTARNDGKVAVAGIGLNATAPSAGPTQSELILMADQFFFVPSMAGINGPLQSLLAAGVVDGQPTTVFNSLLWGDKTVPARVLVDGFLEARHITAGSIKVDKLDTKGITIKDADGNIILSAEHNLDWARISNVQITNAQISGDLYSENFVQNEAGWRIRRQDGSAEFNNVKVRGDIKASSLEADTVTTANLQADAAIKVVTNYSGDYGSAFLGKWGASDVLSASIVISSATAQVLINSVVSWWADSSGDGYRPAEFIRVSLLRNGSVVVGSLVLGIPKVQGSNSGTGDTLFFGRGSGVIAVPPLVDAPGVGTHTYTLRLHYENDYNGNAFFVTLGWRERGMTLLEKKK